MLNAQYVDPLLLVCRIKCCGSGSAWIRNICLDPDPELGKFKAGSGSRINHSGSTNTVNE